MGVGMGVARLLAGMLSRIGHRGPRTRHSRPRGVPLRAAAAQRANVGFLDPNSFALALSRRTDEDQRLHVFSLSDFRQAVGGKWDRLSLLLETAGDAIIRRHVDLSHDVITRLDAEIACLSLPGTGRREAHAKVASIAADLSNFLFGDAVINGRRPQVVAANMAARDAVAEDGTLDHEAIRRAVAGAGAALAAAPELAAPHRATLAAMLPPAEIRAKTPQGPIAAVSGDNDRPYRIDQSRVPLWVLEQHAPEPLAGADAPREVMRIESRQGKGADWLEEQLERAAEERLASGAALKAESSLTLVWPPTWVATKRAIGAFHAKVIRVDGEGAVPQEGTSAYAEAAPIESLTMDRFVAGQAARELMDIHFTRRRTGLTVPVHWMSLAPRWRDCIRIPFESCPPQVLRRHLKLEVFGLTPAVPPHVVARLFDPLEKLNCTVMARLPLSAAGMVKAMRGVKAIGIDLAELPPDERTGDDDLLGRLERFRDTAHGAGMACYVWGIRRRPLIERVIKAGFSLVNGPGVMCDLAQPKAPSGS